MAPATAPAVDYDLNTHAGEVTTAFRLRDTGIRLDGDRLRWSIDGVARDAALADIEAIRLTSEVETMRGPIGATSCQIRFLDGRAVTVFGGNSLSPDPAARRARYEAFVADLHRRLERDDRARIRFVAGFGGARFGILLVAALLSVTLFLVGPLVGLLIKPSPRILIGLVFGVIINAGLFRLLQLNAPHLYDPINPLRSASSGSIGDTFGTAIREFRHGMTRRGEMAYAAIGAALIVILVLVVASHQRVNLFEPGRAHAVSDAVFAHAGGFLSAIYVAVTPDEMLIEGPPARDSSRRTDWRASRRTLFGWSEWDDVVGPTVRYPMSMSDEPGEEPFTLERGDIAHLDDLAKGAIERAALGTGASVTRMTLIAPFTFAHPEPPRWAVEVAGAGGRTTIYADRTGRLFPATPAPLGSPRIVIKIGPANPFSMFAGGDTWLRLTNPDRSVRFDGALKTGESYSVPNIPGMILQTGKPEVLQVTVDGHPVQLPRPGYAGRLETVLDPDALLASRTAKD
jgi:hypothetical protein